MLPDLGDLILQDRIYHLHHLFHLKGMVEEMEATMMVVDITVTHIHQEGAMDMIDLLPDMAEETEVVVIMVVVIMVVVVTTVIDMVVLREGEDTMEEVEGSKIGHHPDMIEE